MNYRITHTHIDRLSHTYVVHFDEFGVHQVCISPSPDLSSARVLELVVNFHSTRVELLDAGGEGYQLHVIGGSKFSRGLVRRALPQTAYDYVQPSFYTPPLTPLSALLPRCDFTPQLCAAGVTTLRFGTRNQSAGPEDLIASMLYRQPRRLPGGRALARLCQGAASNDSRAQRA